MKLKIKLRAVKIVFFVVTLLAGKAVLAQQCMFGLGGSGCIATNQINSVEISGTTLVNNNNTCTGNATNTQTIFPASGNTYLPPLAWIKYLIMIIIYPNWYNIISRSCYK